MVSTMPVVVFATLILCVVLIVPRRVSSVLLALGLRSGSGGPSSTSVSDGGLPPVFTPAATFVVVIFVVLFFYVIRDWLLGTVWVVISYKSFD
jgi:hypothetical protein